MDTTGAPKDHRGPDGHDGIIQVGRWRQTFRPYAILLLVWAIASGFGRDAVSSEWLPRPGTEIRLSAASDSREPASPAPPAIAHIVRRLPARTGVMTVAWSPDGKVLATMGGLKQHLALWDPRIGTMLWETTSEFGGGGEALAFSNDGRLLLTPAARSGSGDQQAALTLWDAAKGTIVGDVAGPSPKDGWIGNFARAIALDRGHELMAVVTGGRVGQPIGIYDMRHWAPEGTIVMPKDISEVAAFGPDGTLAVGTALRKIALFDVRTRTLKRVIDAGQHVGSLVYSPDGKYIASGHADLPDPIRIWSTADGTLVRSFEGKFSDINGLAWSPDGRYIASASFDKAIRLWPVTTNGGSQVVATFKGGAWCVAFSPDGRFLAGGSSEDDAIIAEIK